MKEAIKTSQAPAAIGPYSQAIKANGFVYLSGQVALDSKTGEEIMALLEDLYSRGNTIILVTHERDIAAHARRTVHLRDGLIEMDHAGFIPELDVPIELGTTA